MAKPEHTRVTLEGVFGTLAAPLEHWSININFPADALPADGTEIVANGVATDCHQAWVDNIAPVMPVDVRLTRVKVAHVLATGLVATRGDGSYVQGVWEGEVLGALSATGMPLQTALVVSLVTARPGPTGKGRFFLPWPAVALEVGTKRLSEADAESWANNAAALLDDLAVVLTFAPQVVSSKGYMTPVHSVRVGRVPDTMRSRREDQPEGYFLVPLG